MRWSLVVLAFLAVVLAGCAKDNPLQPASRGVAHSGAIAALPTGASADSNAARPGPGKPGHEAAYVNGHTVTILAIEIPGKVSPKAQADFYEIVYPTNWEAEGIAPPQCDPCDHDRNGIDPLDFHDHVLDSEPGQVGYRAPWHVFAVVPAYNGDAAHDAAIDALYKEHLPLTSEADMDAFLALRLPGGMPVAIEVDTHFFFLCPVVNAHATK